MRDIIMIIVIVAIVQRSGWWDTLDEWVEQRIPLHHLPRIFRCGFCQTFWLSAAYLMISLQLGLIEGVFLALVAAYTYDFVPPLLGIIRGLFDNFCERITKKL